MNFVFCGNFAFCGKYVRQKSSGHREIYLRVKNDVPEDGGTVLVNSAQIYCGAMDQAASMGYSGWIRDEVAIHFDIFTVRTVRLQE